MIFSAITSVMAQNLIIDGRLTDIDSKKRIADVTITVFDGTKQIFQTTSAASGKYEVSIPVNKNLRVQYTKNGFITKTMIVNTNGINEEDIPIGGKIFPPIDIDLFINRPNIDFSFLKTEPVVEWNYDSNSQSMSYNEGKMQAMKSKIENLLEKALNDAKKNEANYNQLIFDADKLFIAQNLENALNKYSESISIPGKAAESHPNNRIIEIDNLLKLKAKKDMLEQQANQAYLNVVDAADKFYDNKEYEKAAAKYKEAQAMNPTEQYPEDRLADIEAIRKAAASKVEYDEFIKSADMFFKQNSLKAAEDKYLKAAKLDPSQEYPKSQLEKIVKKLKEQENILASKKKYDDAIISADAFFQNEKYFEAKQKYEEAVLFESAATYPVDRAKICAEKLKEQQETQELQNKYDDFIKAGDAAMKSSNYDDAIAAFTEAIGIKKEAYPGQQLKLAQDKLAALADGAAKKAKIDELFSSADSKIAAENFTGAIEDYKAIVALESTNTKAITKKVEAEAALKAQKNNESKLAQFSEIKSQGDDFYANEKWTEALGKYEAAKKLVSDDTHVNDRIAESKNKLNQLAKNTEKQKFLKKLMDEGVAAEGKSDWSLAIKKYEEVLKNDENNAEAIQKLESAKKSMDDSKNDAVFQKLLAEGQKLKNADQLSAAKDVYVQAQQMRPADAVPQNAIVEINDLLRKRVEEEDKNAGELAVNKKYDEKLDVALISAQNFDFENAIIHLKEASKIKPEQEFPRQKIMEYQLLLDETNASKTRESKYKNAIAKADVAYDTKKYEESIEFYREAIGFQDTKYPNDQITKAELAIKNRGEVALNREYQNSIKKANDFFSSERYENARTEYNNALTILPGDKYAQDRRDETQQILNNLTRKSQKELEDKSTFNQTVSEADGLFDDKNYTDAKIKYEEALTYFSSNPYALNRVGECIRLSKEKNEELSELAYRDVIDEADEFFRLENYDQAKKVYESAISLKPSDAYPKNQLDEIKRILNRSVKEETSLQYLGEEVNISILDGEALFANSEKQREQDKKQGVFKRIFANEKSVEEKGATDWSERNEYQNEIVFLRDRRASLNVDNNSDKQVLAINLDGEQFSLSKQRLQENNFERASILRQNNEILFILEDFNALHGENNEKHLVNADKLDLIVLDKVDLDRSMTALEEVNRRNTTAELIGISDDVKEDGQRAIDMKKVNDNVVRNLDVNLSAKSDNETFKNYEKLQVLTSDATIAEINRYNSSIEKSLIQFELEEDIALLAGLQSEKAYREARELQKSALEMDANIFAANEKYKASFADNDLARKETIEDIKVLQAGDAERKIVDNDRKYTELQANTMEIETVKKLNEAKVVTMDDDLLAIREEIVAQEKMITRIYAEKNSSEISKREANVDAIDNVAMNTNKAHSEQSKKPSDNSEGIMNLESALNAGEQSRKDDFTNRKYETTKMLDDMASNKIQFSEAIANTLGDEFPDGVSQQTYLAKDKDGYPQKVTTRRIVVADGRGEVYLRIKTRNAATYSKNGQPITEASWLKGTENANLVRHF